MILGGPGLSRDGINFEKECFWGVRQSNSLVRQGQGNIHQIKNVEKAVGHGRKCSLKEEASMVRNGDFSSHVLTGECFKIKDIKRYLILNNPHEDLTHTQIFYSLSSVGNSTIQGPVL